MELINITSYGDGSEDSMVQILVPHDASYSQFALEFPDLLNDILKAIETDEETFRKFVTIEQDKFATEAADLLARKIVEGFQGRIRVQVIKVVIPRAILDMNRIEEKALWHIFDHEKHPALTKRLLDFYRTSYKELKKIVQQSNVLIDLHTMCPTDPWEKILLNPHNVEEFNKSWRHNPLKRRVTDLITHQSVGEIVDRLGDMEIIEKVEQAFKMHGIEHKRSATFQLTNIHLGTEWAQLARSYFNIDITKDWGAKESTNDESFDVSSITYDESKMSKIVSVIGDAIINVVKERLSKTKVLVN